MTESAAYAMKQQTIVLIASALLFAQNPVKAQQFEQTGFDCLVEPSTSIELATPVSGVITEVLVDRGSTVQAGDVVARLDSSLQQASVAIAEARADNGAVIKGREQQVEFLTRRMERTTALATANVASSATADEVATELQVAIAELADAELSRQVARLELIRAQQEVDQRTIRAPISGIVTEQALSGGEFAYEQAYILAIAQTNPLNVELYLPVAEYGRVSQGMHAQVTLAEPIGGTYDAEVTVIDQVFDQRSGTFGVRLSLPNPDNALPAGLRCVVVFPEPAAVQ